MKFSFLMITLLGFLTCTLARSVSVRSVEPGIISSELKSSISTPITYQQHIRPIIEQHCLSCHGARKASKRQLHTYELVKDKIDDILYRVQLEPSNRKFMPYKMRQAPLSRMQIALLQSWKDGEMIRK